MSHDNMSIEGYVDGDLIAIDEPSNTQINGMSDIDVYYSGKKIGELIIQQECQTNFNKKSGPRQLHQKVYALLAVLSFPLYLHILVPALSFFFLQFY